jgi:hypothetical protein
MTRKVENPPPRWNPYQTFVWSKKELQNWYDAFGSQCAYDGRLWKPKTKSLGAGRYEISFKCI